MVRTTRRWICDICQEDFKGGDMRYATEEDYNNLRPEGVCALDLTYPIKDVNPAFEASYSHDRKYITRYKTLSLDMCDKCAKMLFDHVVNAIRMSGKSSVTSPKTNTESSVDPEEYTHINPDDLVVTREEIEQRFPEEHRKPKPEYSYGICNDSKVISNNKTSKSMLESIKLRHPFGNENI